MDDTVILKQAPIRLKWLEPCQVCVRTKWNEITIENVAGRRAGEDVEQRGRAGPSLIRQRLHGRSADSQAGPCRVRRGL